jgi:Ca-activated chloride channel family protein
MKYPLSAALALAAACALPLIVSAQAKPTDIYVSVVDGKGDPASGLTAEDFRVREDGVAREVLKAGTATEPLTVALVVDDSQAIQPAVQMIREAMDEFLKALDGKAEIALVTFGDRPTILVDYTTDQKKLQDGAKRVFPRSDAGGNLLDTLVEVSKGMQKRKPARPIIAVLMMDNAIEFSNRYYEQVLEEINKAGATLHVVALGQPSTNLSDEVRNRNQVIAVGTERTGGRRDNVLALTAAAPAMKKVAAELLNQYVVTYARPDTLIPPQKIEVTVTKPGLTARARTRTGLAGAK